MPHMTVSELKNALGTLSNGSPVYALVGGVYHPVTRLSVSWAAEVAPGKSGVILFESQPDDKIQKKAVAVLS